MEITTETRSTYVQMLAMSAQDRQSGVGDKRKENIYVNGIFKDPVSFFPRIIAQWNLLPVTVVQCTTYTLDSFREQTPISALQQHFNI